MAATIPSRASRLAVVAATAIGAFVVIPTSRGDVDAISPVVSRDLGHVTADVLPTVQIDGVVWDQHILGNRVYVVGEFTSARPPGAAPGTNEVPRSNMLAYDLTTGLLDPTFDASLNAAGMTVTSSPDGSRIYVGGMFTTVNGVSRRRIAALNPVTGAVISSFNATVDYRVNVLRATATTLYAGGAFNAATTGNQRSKLAAFSAGTGALLPWAPVADDSVDAMVISPDGSRVIVGGRFGSLNSVQARGTGALDAATGATLPWAMNSLLATYGSSAAFTDLQTDGVSVFGTAYHFGGSTVKFEGTFSADPSTGELNWINDCHGDTYATTVMNGHVYSVGHAHYCGNFCGFPQSQTWQDNMRHATSTTAGATSTLRPDTWDYKNFTGQPSPSMVNWFPEWQVGSVTSAGMAGWTVEHDSNYLVIGGEFLRVNNVAQQGLVRFAVRSIAPNAQGPRLSGSAFVPQVRSFAPGRVRISFPANWDRDSADLEYRLVRNGDTANPIATTTVGSTFWHRPSIGFTDTGLPAGSTQTYRVRASDSDGNIAWSDTVSVTVASGGSPSPYADAVMVDRPSFHWRFEEPAGATTSAADWLRRDDGVVSSGVTRGAAGAMLNEPANASYSFNGTVNARVTQNGSPRLRPVIDTFTLETWIRTTTTQGGRILGFSNSATGTSTNSNADRHLYMANNGRVLFGVHPDSRYTVTSPTALNDGNWHHVVGTLGDSGLSLYVDGVLVDDRADVRHGRPYYGVWRVGGDTLTGWASAPTNANFNGSIDEAAVYEYQTLPADRVAAHYAASGRTPALLAAPTDPYGASVASSQPVLYYRLQDTPLTQALDSGIRRRDGDYVGSSGSITSAGGVLAGLAGAEFDGTGGVVASRAQFYAPENYTLEGWFRTTTTTGGSLVSLGSQRTGTSTTVSRQVAMADDGTLVFRATNASTGARVTSPLAYNDGAWHHWAATHSSSGMRLYVDGSVVGQNSVPVGQASLGYWRVGNDVTGGIASSASFRGVVDEVAVHDRILSASEIADHVALGGVEPVNATPVASFEHTADFLTVAFDGSSSSDPDGALRSWTWDFGDGTTGTGAVVGHTFGAAGTYAVTLTVADDLGATSSLTRHVQVTASPAGTVIAADEFTRTVTNGWGSTPTGGTWTTSGSAGQYAVDAGRATHRMGAPGVGPTSFLGAVTAADVALAADVSWDKAPTGGGVYASLAARRVGTSDYRARVRAMPSSTTLTLSRVTGNVETSLTTITVPGLTVAAGESLRVRFDVEGMAPTVLSAKVWKVGQTEPAAWQVVTSDQTAGLQGPGAVGLASYLTGSATNAPVTASFRHFSAKVPGVPPPPVDQPPVAAFTHTVSGLSVSLDGSSSTDDHGIASYVWGVPGGSASGVTATHVFTAPGTYDVALTVTDTNGATDTVVHQVTVVAPPAAIAADDFERTVVNGFGTATSGAAWSLTGSASSFAVGDGAGRITLTAPGQTRGATLAGVAVTDVDARVDLWLDKPPSAGGGYYTIAVRRSGTSDYGLRVRLQATATTLQLIRTVDGAVTVLSSTPIAGYVSRPGDVLHLRISATGTGPSTLRGALWVNDQAPPTGWLLQTTDATPALQGPGGLGLLAYVSASATETPIVVRVDGLVARVPA